MSFWNVPDADYHELAVATPGWQNAPVPGWGINPLRAGPMRVGIGLGQSIPGEDDFLPHWAALGADPEATYKETSWGVVAGAAALGIGLGLLFGYAWWGKKKLTPNRRFPRRYSKRTRTALRARWERSGRPEKYRKNERIHHVKRSPAGIHKLIAQLDAMESRPPSRRKKRSKRFSTVRRPW
jgi:hypothetical protein